MRWPSKGKHLSLSLVTRTHKVVGENQLLGVVTDLHMCAVPHTCFHTHASTCAHMPHTHAHTQINVKKLNRKTKVMKKMFTFRRKIKNLLNVTISSKVTSKSVKQT